MRLASLLVESSVSYPLTGAFDRVLGACGLLAIIAVLVPSRFAPPAVVRVGAAFWLLTWLPVSHLIMPLQMVLVADRYLLANVVYQGHAGGLNPELELARRVVAVRR